PELGGVQSLHRMEHRPPALGRPRRSPHRTHQQAAPAPRCLRKTVGCEARLKGSCDVESGEMDWILELQRSAQEAFPGASLDELRHAENEIGERLPGELADLYARMSGATLGGEVILFPLTDAHDAGVIEKTRKKMIGLPAAGLWRFGRKGDTTHLIAVRASSIRDVNRPMLPAWCAERPPDAWLFGTWAEHGDDDELKLYPSLERMM